MQYIFVGWSLTVEGIQFQFEWQKDAVLQEAAAYSEHESWKRILVPIT